MIKLFNTIPVKLKCINTGSYYLTKDKVYEGEEYVDSNLFQYTIYNDRGVKHHVEKGLFININEWREERLKNLNL